MNLHSVVFYTNDIEIIEEFYLKVLQFQLDYKIQDKFISFNIGDNGKLGIKKKVEPREIPGHQTIFIQVNDIKVFYEKISAKNIKIEKQLIQEKWAKEFSILDPDGNKVIFRGN